jgi:hypothetical protein
MLGKILTGYHGFYHSIWRFPVNFPLNQPPFLKAQNTPKKHIFNNHPILNATPGLFKSISHLFKFSHYVSNITNIPSQRFLQSFLRRTLKNRCGRPLPRNRRSPCSALFFDLWGRGASCEELCGLHIDSTCLSTYLSGYRNICFYVFFFK